jgi:hypothetical protein
MNEGRDESRGPVDEGGIEICLAASRGALRFALNLLSQDLDCGPIDE